MKEETKLEKAAKLQKRKELQAQILEKADKLQFNRNACVKNFHKVIYGGMVSNENDKLIELKKEMAQARKEQEKKIYNEVEDRLEEAQKREQEKAQKKILIKRAFNKAQRDQIKDNEQRRQLEKQLKSQEQELRQQQEEKYKQDLQ